MTSAHLDSFPTIISSCLSVSLEKLSSLVSFVVVVLLCFVFASLSEVTAETILECIVKPEGYLRQLFQVAKCK